MLLLLLLVVSLHVQLYCTHHCSCCRPLLVKASFDVIALSTASVIAFCHRHCLPVLPESAIEMWVNLLCNNVHFRSLPLSKLFFSNYFPCLVLVTTSFLALATYNIFSNSLLKGLFHYLRIESKWYHWVGLGANIRCYLLKKLLPVPLGAIGF